MTPTRAWRLSMRPSNSFAAEDIESVSPILDGWFAQAEKNAAQPRPERFRRRQRVAERAVGSRRSIVARARDSGIGGTKRHVRLDRRPWRADRVRRFGGSRRRVTNVAQEP